MTTQTIQMQTQTQTQTQTQSLTSSWRTAAQETARSWSEMVQPSTLSRDLSAGLSVACVALPLNLALATAAGLPAGTGLVTGVIAGVVAALLGGSRLQVTGPEAALVPLTAAIVQAHGAAGLEAALVICGLLQLVFGFLGLGRLIRFVPPQVVAGFTAGIGLLLLNRQLPRLLGLGDSYASVWQLASSFAWLPQVEVAAVMLGALMIATMVLLPRWQTKVPAVLTGLLVVTACAWLGHLELPLVGELPRMLPSPELPSIRGVPFFEVLPNALMLTLLASMGSLLATTSLDSVVKDPRRPSNYDQELLGQGLANLASAAFGGLPVMGAIVRATASVQAGARTRAASVFHSLWLLVAMLVAAPLVSHIPTTALAAILVVVGVRLLNLKGVADLARRSAVNAAILVATAVLIVTTNFLFGVAMGLAMSFVRTLIRQGTLNISQEALPVRSVFGHRGLGGAHIRESTAVLAKASGAITFLNHTRLYTLIDGAQWPRMLVLDLSEVPMIDSAGRETLEYLAEFLAIRGSQFAVVGAQRSVKTLLRDTALNHFAGGCVHDTLEGVLKVTGWTWAEGDEQQPTAA